MPMGQSSSLAGGECFFYAAGHCEDRPHTRIIYKRGGDKEGCRLLKEQAAPSYEAFMQAPCLRRKRMQAWRMNVMSLPEGS